MELSIVNENFLLTAAHCCFQGADYKVNVTIKGLYALTGLHEWEILEPRSQNLSIAVCIVNELYR